MKHKLWLIIAALLVFSLACSLFSSDEATPEGPGEEATAVALPEVLDTATPEEAPPDTPVEDEPVDDDEAPSVDSDALSELDSYRARLSWEVTKADGTTEAFAIEQAATRDPQAEHFLMEAADGSMEYIQIGNQTWMRFDDQWMQSTSDEAEPDEFGDAISSGEEWVSDADEGDYEFLGREEVNGVQTRHYRIEREQNLLGLLGDAADVDRVERSVADVWIADEADLPEFVVRFVVEAEYEGDEEEGTITLTQNVYDVNEPFTIEPPADAATGGLPEGVPLYPDATELTSFGTMTTFSSADDVTTVADFYEEALTGAGWSLTEESISTEEMVMNQWQKDGKTLTLNVGAEDDGTTVLIMIEGEE
ncbi:MAG: hypothetical protein ACP5HG_08730 [Anaerolineae bacterium]